MQGCLSAWLVKHELTHRLLGFDYQGIEEILQIKSENWHTIIVIYMYMVTIISIPNAPIWCSPRLAIRWCISLYENRVWYESMRRGMDNSIYLKEES